MALAAHIASWNGNPERKCGAVVVGPDREIRATGYNGFVRGVEGTDARKIKPTKYLWSLCAERNAICNAARTGVSVKGCTIYVSPLFPCAECAKEIIQSGITRVVCGAPDLTDVTYAESFRVAQEMLDEASVEIAFFTQPVGEGSETP